MKFKSLRDLTHKQLLQYGVIGIAFGYIGDLLKVGPFTEIIFAGISVLGWICLIWGVFKWLEGRLREKKKNRNGE